MFPQLKWFETTLLYGEKMLITKIQHFFPEMLLLLYVMDLTQSACGILKLFAIPSEDIPCLSIDRHTYKNGIM